MFHLNIFLLMLLASAVSPFVLDFQNFLNVGGGSFLSSLYGNFIPKLDSALGSIILFGFHGVPISIVAIVFVSLFLTIKYRFVNVRFFINAFKNMFFDSKHEVGAISHFQAFATAVSGTVGLGTISGVAVGISVGGPGVVGWMMLFGFLAMSVKFTEVYLSFKYRMIKKSGEIIGGPFAYIRAGMEEIGYAKFGVAMAMLYAIAITCAGLAGSVPFQANQLMALTVSKSAWAAEHIKAIAFFLAALSATVIAGGIKKISMVTSILTPVMTVFYIVGCAIVIIYYSGNLIDTLSLIVRSMFDTKAASGGLFGILVVSYSKALFANEAGMGTAATYHATAKDHDPFRAALVAMIEPFFDTVLMCCITGVVVLVSHAYTVPNLVGVQMAIKAFGSVSEFMPVFVYISVPLFAFSTIISFSYNCEMAFRYMFGQKSLKYLRILVFLVIYFAGISSHFERIASVGDKVFLIAALVNVTSIFILRSKVIPCSQEGNTTSAKKSKSEGSRIVHRSQT